MRPGLKASGSPWAVTAGVQHYGVPWCLSEKGITIKIFLVELRNSDALLEFFPPTAKQSVLDDISGHINASPTFKSVGNNIVEHTTHITHTVC